MRLRIFITLLLVAVIASATPAVATKLITGRDIRNGSVTERDLDTKVRGKLRDRNAPGPQGERGPVGPQGTQGAPGAFVKGDKGDTGSQGLQGLTGAAGAPGADGVDGAPGEKGDKGDPGRDGVSGLHYTAGVIESYVNEPGPYTLRATCPSGKKPISGGYRIIQGDIQVVGSYAEPVSPNEAWAFDIIAGTGNASIVVSATCIDA